MFLGLSYSCVRAHPHRRARSLGAGTSWGTCREKQRRFGTLWAWLAGFLSRALHGRAARVAYLSAIQQGGQPWRGWWGGWGVVGGWEMDHRKKEAEICSKSGSR